MSDTAIRVEGLGKQYRRGLPSGHDRLSEALSNLARAALELTGRLWRRPPAGTGPAAPPERTGEFWALKDVSFEVKRGEVVGIIGRNGAGKSTLLKILSRITEPTEGRFGVRGRIGSLLEVGTGFHPELTGRENVFLNGTFLGMGRQEIVRKFDEIAAFAEIDDFLDTPVKRYSSGMQVRLGFAVAAHLEPEVLIVDEALAVGDAAFQRKCLERIRQIAADGRTVLFVSHSTNLVVQLCSRAVLFRAGELVADDSAERVLRRYTQELQAAQPAGGQKDQPGTCRRWDSWDEAPGDDAVRVRRVALTPESEIGLNTPIRLEVSFWNRRPDTVASVSVVLTTADGTVVLNTYPSLDHPWTRKPLPVGVIRTVCEIPPGLLNDETYTMRVLLVRDGSQIACGLDKVIQFTVKDDSERWVWTGKHVGVVRPKLDWSVEVGPPDETGDR